MWTFNNRLCIFLQLEEIFNGHNKRLKPFLKLIKLPNNEQSMWLYFEIDGEYLAPVNENHFKIAKETWDNEE